MDIPISRRTLLLTALAAQATGAMAQEWPQRPVKFIVPFPAGQAVDSFARLIADRVGANLGQAVVTENRPGAGSMVGSEAAAKAKADGYTYLIGGSSALSINPHLFKSLAYDPLKDFDPVAVLATFPYAICVPAASGIRSLQDLLQAAREKPNEMSFGTSGPGSTAQIISHLLAVRAGVKMLEVSYKGAPQILTDVVAGRLGFVVETVTTVHGLISGGKLRPIAVTTLKRVSSLPDVPTLDELGITGFDAAAWTGLVAPSGTPASILDRMHREVARTMTAPDVVSQLKLLFLEPLPITTREAAGDYIRGELVKWGRYVKTSGVSLA